MVYFGLFSLFHAFSPLKSFTKNIFSGKIWKILISPEFFAPPRSDGAKCAIRHKTLYDIQTLEIPVLLYFKMLRPQQWTKNVFVLFPALFGGVMKTMTLPQILELSGAAFLAFCAWSSAVYILNDILDRHADAQHPRKKHRPIASGKIRISAAVGIALLLLLVPLAGSIFAPRWFPERFPDSFHLLPFLGLAYVFNNILYCIIFRNHVLLDVFSIAIGFVLRVLAGCCVLGLEPSIWILVCTFSLALYLGFGKRRMEVACLTPENDYRSVLHLYPPEFLNFLLAVSGCVCIVAYLLYTLSPETAALHRTKALIFSVPFVFYGIFRYALDAMKGLYDGPDEVLFHDRAFFINILCWVACVVVVLLQDSIFG